MLKIVVLAGDHQQATVWLQRHGLTSTDPQVVVLEQDRWRRMLMGMLITPEDRVVLVGNCWRRRDFHDVWEELQCRGWNGEYESSEW